jgi:hypothetical protein
MAKKRHQRSNRIGTFPSRKAALDAFFSRKQPTSDAGTLIVEG